MNRVTTPKLPPPPRGPTGAPVRAPRRAHDRALGGDHSAAAVVAGQAVQPGEPADATTQGEPATPWRRFAAAPPARGPGWRRPVPPKARPAPPHLPLIEVEAMSFRRTGRRPAALAHRQARRLCPPPRTASTARDGRRTARPRSHRSCSARAMNAGRRSMLPFHLPPCSLGRRHPAGAAGREAAQRTLEIVMRPRGRAGRVAPSPETGSPPSPPWGPYFRHERALLATRPWVERVCRPPRVRWGISGRRRPLRRPSASTMVAL